jgi:hypothetical protein
MWGNADKKSVTPSCIVKDREMCSEKSSSLAQLAPMAQRPAPLSPPVVQPWGGDRGLPWAKSTLLPGLPNDDGDELSRGLSRSKLLAQKTVMDKRRNSLHDDTSR